MLGGEIRGLDAETVRLLRHKMPAHSSNDAASIILEPGGKRTDFSERTEDRGKAIVLACRPGDFAEFIHP